MHGYDRRHRQFHSKMRCRALAAFVEEERSKSVAKRFVKSSMSENLCMSDFSSDSMQSDEERNIDQFGYAESPANKLSYMKNLQDSKSDKNVLDAQSFGRVIQE